MGSLASRLHGGDLLTMQEFAFDIVERLTYEDVSLTVTQPGPGLIAVSAAGRTPVEFNLQSVYRDYQKNPRAREQVVQRLVRWVIGSTAAR